MRTYKTEVRSIFKLSEVKKMKTPILVVKSRINDKAKYEKKSHPYILRIHVNNSSNPW